MVPGSARDNKSLSRSTLIWRLRPKISFWAVVRTRPFLKNLKFTFLRFRSPGKTTRFSCPRIGKCRILRSQIQTWLTLRTNKSMSFEMEYWSFPHDFVVRASDLVTFWTIIISDFNMCALRTCLSVLRILRKVLQEIVGSRSELTEIPVNTVFYGLFPSVWSRGARCYSQNVQPRAELTWDHEQSSWSHFWPECLKVLTESERILEFCKTWLFVAARRIIITLWWLFSSWPKVVRI